MESRNLHNHYTIYLVAILIVFEEKISRLNSKMYKPGIIRNKITITGIFEEMQK